DLGLPYKTAWSLAHRIREAMLSDPAQAELFKGIVEMDETFVGGKPRKGNERKGGGEGSGGEGSPVEGSNLPVPAEPKPKSKRGRGTDKMPVVGIVERGGRVVAKVFRKESMDADGMTEFYL